MIDSSVESTTFPQRFPYQTQATPKEHKGASNGGKVPELYAAGRTSVFDLGYEWRERDLTAVRLSSFSPRSPKLIQFLEVLAVWSRLPRQSF